MKSGLVGHTDESLFELYGGLCYLQLLYNTMQSSGTYRLCWRLVGSAEADVAATGSAGKRQGSSWPFTATRVIRDRRFALRTAYEPGSADSFGVNYSAAYADTRDDEATAKVYAEALREARENETAHGSLILAGLTRAYPPGTAVSGTIGRRINFGEDAPRIGDDGRLTNRRWPVVASVAWQLEEDAARTEILLDTALTEMLR
ncbi:MAG TPA: hypothetical protein VMW52_02110 [Phycisphaerae bacterium]|nr:hypothetical protein [Phycisphaerae bacterium]